MTNDSIEGKLLLEEGLRASATGDNRNAIDLFSRAVIAVPESGIPHALMGAEYAALGDFERAEACYANAALLAPELWIARFQLGLLQFIAGRTTIALLTWQPLTNLTPNDPLRLFVMGFSALAQDAKDDAISLFRNGISANSANPALSADIERIIKRISTPELAPSIRGEPENRATNGHVLLANYLTR